MGLGPARRGLLGVALVLPSITWTIGVDGAAGFQIIAVEDLGIDARTMGIGLGLGVLSVPLQLWAARLPLWQARRNLQLFLVVTGLLAWALAALVVFAPPSSLWATGALVIAVTAEIVLSVFYATSWQPLLSYVLTSHERQRIASWGRAASSALLALSLLAIGAASTGGRVAILLLLGALGIGLAVLVRPVPAPPRPSPTTPTPPGSPDAPAAPGFLSLPTSPGSPGFLDSPDFLGLPESPESLRFPARPGSPGSPDAPGSDAFGAASSQATEPFGAAPQASHPLGSGTPQAGEPSGAAAPKASDLVGAGAPEAGQPFGGGAVQAGDALDAGVALAGGAATRGPGAGPGAQGRVRLPREFVALCVTVGITTATAWPLFVTYAADVLWPTANLGLLAATQIGGGIVAGLAWRTTVTGLVARARLGAAGLLLSGGVVAALDPPVTGGLAGWATLAAAATFSLSLTTMFLAMMELAHQVLDAEVTVRAFTIYDVVASTAMQVGALIAGFLVAASAGSDWPLDPYRLYLVAGSTAVLVTMGRRGWPGALWTARVAAPAADPTPDPEPDPVTTP